MALPSERKVWQFNHATVIFTCEKDFNGRIRPKLYVQVIDQYRYQREWSLEYRHRSGDSNDMYWESHAYRHPGRRHIEEMSQSAAKRLIERFIHLTEGIPYSSFQFGER